MEISFLPDRLEYLSWDETKSLISNGPYPIGGLIAVLEEKREPLSRQTFGFYVNWVVSKVPISNVKTGWFL